MEIHVNDCIRSVVQDAAKRSSNMCLLCHYSKKYLRNILVLHDTTSVRINPKRASKKLIISSTKETVIVGIFYIATIKVSASASNKNQIN